MTRHLPLTMSFAVLVGMALTACSEAPSFDRTGAAATLAKTIAAGEDHVTVAELSDWLIKDRRDFALLDIREQADFDAGSIEGARHVPLAGLMSDLVLDGLPSGRKVVVYSNGSAHAAQAALLLRLVGRDAYALLGGYNYWQAYLNDPQAAGVAEMDPVQRAAYQAVACRFAGDYVAAAGLSVAQAPAPAPASAPVADDPLGLGLGLGLGTPAVQQAAPATAPAADPLGLGLGLGLGSDEVKAAQPPASTPAPTPPTTGRLLIKAEC